MIHVGVLNENREASLSLRAQFPKDPSAENFQRVWFYFYGDAFQNLESDFMITPVNELHEIPDPLKAHESVVSLAGIGLHKLQLTYEPEKVVTKAKDDPDEFLAESSLPAYLFRSLVDREGPMTLSLYFRANPIQVEALDALKERLRVEKDVRPFEEYRDKNGLIRLVIQVLVYLIKLTVSGSNSVDQVVGLRLTFVQTYQGSLISVPLNGTQPPSRTGR